VTFLSVLPLAFVMVAGPQILSAVFLATSERWQANSAAFVAGAALSISIVATLAFLLGLGAKEGAGNDALYIAVLALLAFAMVRTYLRREEAEPPAWMGRLQTATPGFSFRLGFLLLGVFPTDIVTSVAVGGFVAAQDESLLHALPFLAMTLLLLSLPALTVAALGERGESVLPRVRDWMNANSWVVNEVVLAFFVVITASNL
jgi:hypothetical protein